MDIKRDKDGRIQIKNSLGEEIHPFLTVLSAIELQKSLSFPVKVPELTMQGWDIVVESLKSAIRWLKIDEKTSTVSEFDRSDFKLISEIKPPPAAKPTKPSAIKKITLIPPAEKQRLKEQQNRIKLLKKSGET